MLPIPAVPVAVPRHVAPVEDVRIIDFDYTPRRVTLGAGGRLRWVNRDISNHTVTFRHGPDLGNIDPRRSRSLRFARPGRYRYVCVYHPGMRGTVVVHPLR